MGELRGFHPAFPSEQKLSRASDILPSLLSLLLQDPGAAYTPGNWFLTPASDPPWLLTALGRKRFNLALQVLLFFFYFLFFLGLHLRHMEVPRLGSNWSCSCRTTPQPQQRQIWATSATYTTAHGNARALINWARDRTCVLIDTCQICFCWAMKGTLSFLTDLSPALVWLPFSLRLEGETAFLLYLSRERK